MSALGLALAATGFLVARRSPYAEVTAAIRTGVRLVARLEVRKARERLLMAGAMTEYERVLAMLSASPNCMRVTEVTATTVTVLSRVPRHLRRQRVPPPLPDGWRVKLDANDHETVW